MKAPRRKSTLTVVIFATMVGFWSQAIWAAPPPGKGGGKDEDPVVTMTFRDGPDDRIYSDGNSYVDGSEGAYIKFHRNGQAFQFNVTEPRGLWLDFSEQAEPSGCGVNCNKGELPTPVSITGAAGAVSVPVAFLDMAVGDSQSGQMKIGWGPSDFRWSVRFQQTTQGRDAALDQGILDNSTFVQVTRPEESTWVIEGIEPSSLPGAGDRGLLWSRTGRGKHETYFDEGTYHLPFSLTVTSHAASAASVPEPSGGFFGVMGLVSLVMCAARLRPSLR